jgi:OmcA/MtrC family decaheme c-type cytochrome
VSTVSVEGVVDTVSTAGVSAAAADGTVDIINPATGETLSTATIGDDGKFSAEFKKPGDQFAILFVAKFQGQDLRNLSFFDLIVESGTLVREKAVVRIRIDEASTALANEVLGEGVNRFPEGEGYASMLKKYQDAGGYAFSLRLGDFNLVGQVGGEPGAVETVGDSDPVKFSVYDDGHQKVYNSTEDTSFEAKITDIYSSPTDNKTTVTISVTKDGKPYAGSFPGWEFSFYWTVYDNGKYSGYITPGSPLTIASNNDGTFDITFSPAVEMKPNMIFYLGGVRAERKVGPRDYFGEKDYVNAVYVEGDVPAVQADPKGCDNCHMKNLLKHGYISTRPIDQNGKERSFLNCVVCHNNGRPSHDGTPADALNLNGDNTTDSTLRNTVHAYHVYAKYPQSMSNCVTCHTDGQLEYVVSNAFKDYDTCQTCHGDLLRQDVDNEEDYLIKNESVRGFHRNIYTGCYTCHGDEAVARNYAEIHNGGYSFSKYYYDTETKKATRWSERVKYKIDKITYDNESRELTVNWSVLVDGKLYDLNDNYETADFDFGTDNLTDKKGAYVLVGYLGFGSKDVVAYVRANTSINGDGTATSTLTLDNTTLTEYDVKAVKVGILGAPAYKGSATLNDSRHIAVTNITENFDLETKSRIKDVGLTVSQAKCDSCHNELIIHGSGYVGNPDSCMFCHNPASAAGYYAEQSRALDTYLHALHEGQPLPDGSGAMEEYPAGSMGNCAKCHIDGFTIPNQIDDLGVYLSGKTARDDRPNRAVTDGVTVGPAAAACGSCHKAYMISHGYDTTSINSHFKVMGYYELTSNVNDYKAVMQKVKSGEIVGESCSTCHRP